MSEGNKENNTNCPALYSSALQAENLFCMKQIGNSCR